MRIKVGQTRRASAPIDKAVARRARRLSESPVWGTLRSKHIDAPALRTFEALTGADGVWATVCVC